MFNKYEQAIEKDACAPVLTMVCVGDEAAETVDMLIAGKGTQTSVIKLANPWLAIACRSAEACDEALPTVLTYNQPHISNRRMHGHMYGCMYACMDVMIGGR